MAHGPMTWGGESVTGPVAKFLCACIVSFAAHTLIMSFLHDFPSKCLGSAETLAQQISSKLSPKTLEMWDNYCPKNDN